MDPGSVSLVRQTALAGGVFAGSSRAFRLDPFTLPVRCPASHEAPAFVLDRHRAVVRRAMRAGGAATFAVPVSAYAGVSVRVVPAGEDGDIRVFVELMHRDPALTLPLVVADEPEDAAADWLAWGKALNLPLLVVEQDGTVRSPVERMGGLVVSKPGPRRNRSLFRGRRSRAIRHRRPGRRDGLEQLAGREIIARD
jgi:hypothetical protein